MRNGTGPVVGAQGTVFDVWAPKPEKVELYLPAQNQLLPMIKDGDYWHLEAEGVGPGTKYCFRLNGTVDRPDPASRYQPDGVHGPSEVVDHCFPWKDDCWFGLPLHSHVIYELHVGTFSKDGTFPGIIPRLADLKDFGVTAIEIMPVAQFPGSRNWGYDGVCPYAVQNSYGGSRGLKELVDAAHANSIAVILDVVYNHLGPEGNYLGEFGPYFTDAYETPWGTAINFGEADSDAVREYFLNNAIYWLKEYHIDGLRLDACHLIYDQSATHFLEELQRHTTAIGEQVNRRVHCFAESDANDPKYVRSPDLGGYGLDCQWLDDFHHSLYTALNNADAGRYTPDYYGTRHLAKAIEEGFVYSGQYCPSRKRRHGRSSSGINGNKFVVFIQNHDQVGNKPYGTRLASEVNFETQKLAAGAYILSPGIPLIFMGEEYGETAPFLFFTDHSDPALIENIRKGRAEEFDVPDEGDSLSDTQAVDTFTQCILDHSKGTAGEGAVLRSFYKQLLSLRREYQPLAVMDKQRLRARRTADGVLLVERYASIGEEQCLLFFNFTTSLAIAPLNQKGTWSLILNSADKCWGGTGESQQEVITVQADEVFPLTLQPESFCVYYGVEAVSGYARFPKQHTRRVC